ncbi:MAG: hypothetical protein ACREDN_09910 [Aestuariivirga sp.]
MPADDLPIDEVFCQFGMAVFIPDRSDLRLAQLNLQLGDEESELPMPEWIFFDNGREVRRPAAWYEGQHSFVVAAERGLCCMPAPLWPNGAGGRILLIGRQEQPLILEAKPDLISKMFQPTPKSSFRQSLPRPGIAGGLPESAEATDGNGLSTSLL